MKPGFVMYPEVCWYCRYCIMALPMEVTFGVTRPPGPDDMCWTEGGAGVLALRPVFCPIEGGTFMLLTILYWKPKVDCGGVEMLRFWFSRCGAGLIDTCECGGGVRTTLGGVLQICGLLSWLTSCCSFVRLFSC